jgi:hypothetical protein
LARKNFKRKTLLSLSNGAKTFKRMAHSKKTLKNDIYRTTLLRLANGVAFNRMTFSRMKFNRMTFRRITFGRMIFSRIRFGIKSSAELHSA